MRAIQTAACGAVLSIFSTAALAEIDILSVTFTCENDTPIPVSYFNAPDGSGAAAMVIDGTLVALRQTPSGSGIRYESVAADGYYTLRSKGWEATITYQPVGDTAPERVLFKDCSSR